MFCQRLRDPILKWQESTIELVVAVEAADDLLHLDGLHAAVNGTADAQLLLDIVIGEQVDRLASEDVQDVVPEGLEAGAGKIGFYPLGDIVEHAADTSRIR